MKSKLHRFSVCTAFFMACMLSRTSAEWNWEWVNPSFGLHEFYNMAFSGSQNGIVVGRYGCIVVTHNAGNSWKIIPAVTDSTLQQVFYFENKAIVRGNMPNVLISETFGETWNTHPLSVGLKLTNIASFNRRLYALGTKDSAMCALQYGTQIICYDKIPVPVLVQSEDSGKTWTIISNLIDSAALDQPPPMPSTYTGLFFKDSNEGFAVGRQGQLRRTTDGGGTWAAIKTGQNQDLNDIYFITKDTGFIAGSGGVFLRTSDGGITWSVIPVVGTFKLLKIRFADNRLGIVTTDNMPYLLTRDGGKTWTKTYVLNNTYPVVQFCNADTAYLMAQGSEIPMILRSVNGAYNWTATTHALLYGVDQTTFVDSLSGWGVGTSPDAHGMMYKTEDGGRSWKPQAIPSVSALGDIDFADSLSGIAIGANNAITTSDGGQTWRTYNLFEYSYRCHAADSKRFYVGGYNGAISWTVDGGGAWNSQRIGNGGDVLAFQFVTSSTGYCAGNHGISITRDGGATWTEQFPKDHAFRDIHFWGESKGIAVGFNVYDTLVYLMTEDGGKTWNPHPSMMKRSGLEYTDVVFLDSLHGVLIGGDIWITEDAGVSWTQQGISTGWMYSANYLTPNYIVITGSNGKILAGHRRDDATFIKTLSIGKKKHFIPLFIRANGATLFIQNGNGHPIDMSIYSLSGRVIFNARLAGTDREIRFNTTKLGIVPGTYFVTVAGETCVPARCIMHVFR